MGGSKKIRKEIAGKFTRRQKDYIKKGNKAFNCLLKEADVNFLIKGPVSVGRKTAMYSATVVIRFILLLILEFIQVQMLTKPEPFHSFFTTESHVSTEALNTVRSVLSKPGPVRTKFIEVYELTGGEFKRKITSFFTDYYRAIPEYHDEKTGETVNVQELLSSIYKNFFEVTGDTTKIPGALVGSMNSIFLLINTLVEEAIAKTSAKISAKDLLDQSLKVNSKIGEFATDPKLQQLLKKNIPMQAQFGGSISKSPNAQLQPQPKPKPATDSNALICAIKAILFSSPVILVVGFIMNFTTYTVGKLLEIGLQKLLDSIKESVKGASVPRVDELLNTNYNISSNAFLKLFNTMLTNQDKIEKIISSFTSFIDALKGIIDSFIEMYNTKVPEPIKKMGFSYFVKMLQIINSLETAPQLGLDTFLNILSLINISISQVDPEMVNSFFTSTVDRLKTMASSQMASSYSSTNAPTSLPTPNKFSYYDEKDSNQLGGFPVYTARRDGKKFKVNKRGLVGGTVLHSGKINKSIRQFYQTNHVHRRTLKLY